MKGTRWPLFLLIAVLIAVLLTICLSGRWSLDAPLLVACVIGGAIGCSELVARYRDAPGRALWTRPALLYVLVNVAAAAAALVLLRFLNVQFGMNAAGRTMDLDWVRALAAGFGSMALFRSSLFVVRVADQDVGIGPVSLLQVVLAAADRAVDRLRAGSRAEFVAKLMQPVSFARAEAALPTLCLALMQNLPKDDQERLARDIRALSQAGIDDQVKGSILGLALLNAVGEEVLRSAVTSLGTKLHAVREVKVNPTQLALAVGDQALILATAVDTLGQPIDDCPSAWVTTNAAVASVTSDGRVTAVTAGKALIEVTILNRKAAVPTVVT